jgi:hypothetical protein
LILNPIENKRRFLDNQSLPLIIMTRYLTIIFLLFGHLMFSYGQRPDKDKPKHSDWETINLPDNWTLQAPINFKDSTSLGIDSQPGYIYSTKDKIFLEFNSGQDFPTVILNKNGQVVKHNSDCNFRKEVDREKKDLTTYMIPFYNGHYRVSHVFCIDTIGNRVASIITPKVVGKGVTNISIKDCSTGKYLSITGYDLTASIQNLVLEICRTIRLANDEK